uniref:Uncharacterized protein n=1 Tax=Ceratitis capitata TaxID=7213 RepID=W8B6U4_CERCA
MLFHSSLFPEKIFLQEKCTFVEIIEYLKNSPKYKWQLSAAECVLKVWKSKQQTATAGKNILNLLLLFFLKGHCENNQICFKEKYLKINEKINTRKKEKN